MEYKNKEKLKEQNISRITEPKNGLTGTKGKGTREDGWEWRDKVGGKKGGLTISMYNVCEGHGEGCATQRRQVVILQHLITQMDSDCEGVYGGGLVEGGSLVNIMSCM